MFEDTIRALHRLAASQNSISFSSDEEGYFDRECPAEGCLAQFKVLMRDWKEKVRDEAVFCPFCGHVADSGKWWTQEQAAHINSAIRATVGNAIHQAMESDAARWNLNQRGGSLIRMQMRVEHRPLDVLVPLEVASPMRLKITCVECGCHYAVIGAAYFCPSCGHNSADQMFQLTLTGIRQSLGALAMVREAIQDPDAAENTVRLLVESALQHIVAAFQRCAEALYNAIPGATKGRRNVFQNLSEGSVLWASAVGIGYSAHLTVVELTRLTRAFHMRHLLAHTQGIVDADYLAKTSDSTYQLGQRVVVKRPRFFESLRSRG